MPRSDFFSIKAGPQCQQSANGEKKQQDYVLHVPLSPFSILRLICSALQHTECQVAVCDDFSVTFLLREGLRATGFMMLFM